MKIIFIAGFLLVATWVLYVKSPASFNIICESSQSDTIVGSRIITNEMAGSAYRKRAKAYFLVAGTDTSDFKCILSESKDGGKVSVEMRNHNSQKNTKTSRQRLYELRKILPSAALEFYFDSLRSIGLGRLITHGDLAIDVTRQYRKKFGSSNKIPEYKKVSEFLLTSKLASDFNELFRPYSLSVQSISVEKVFFTGRKELKWYGNIETDSTQVPDKILDCITWIRMKPI